MFPCLRTGRSSCFVFRSSSARIKSGRVRGLGVTSLKRVAAAGDMPTLNEQGLKGFETGSWFGMAAPAGTPRDIIAKLHVEAPKAITAPELRDRMSAEGAEFVGDTPEQFAAFIKSEIAKWALAVKASGAKPE